MENNREIRARGDEFRGATAGAAGRRRAGWRQSVGPQRPGAGFGRLSPLEGRETAVYTVHFGKGGGTKRNYLTGSWPVRIITPCPIRQHLFRG